MTPESVLLLVSCNDVGNYNTNGGCFKRIKTLFRAANYLKIEFIVEANKVSTKIHIPEFYLNR